MTCDVLIVVAMLFFSKFWQQSSDVFEISHPLIGCGGSTLIRL